MRLRSLISVVFSAGLAMLMPLKTSADNKDQEPGKGLVYSLGVNMGLDYVASSSGDEIREKIPSDEKINVHTAIPLNIRYAFSFTDPKVRNYLPGGYQGFSLGLLNLGGAEAGGFSKSRSNIGYPILAYIFQGGPFHHFNRNLSLNYEWNFGASFGWKPYSEANKYFNLTVGSRVNAYLSLNMHLAWQINDYVSVFGGVGVSHFSNGNTSFPNPGVNMFGVRVGVAYTLNPTGVGFEPCEPDTLKKRRLEYDVSAWGASRRRVFKGIENPVLRPGHFACAGVSFAPMVRFGRWWRVGGSADLQWDQSADMDRTYISGTTTEDIKFRKPAFLRQVSAGISAHAELQMPIFAVNVGCGYNLVAPRENRGTYQNITLKTYIGPKFFINVGYQLRNFHQQSSLMLGAGVTL